MKKDIVKPIQKRNLKWGKCQQMRKETTRHSDAKQQKYYELEKNYMSASSKQETQRGGEALKHLGN